MPGNQAQVYGVKDTLDQLRALDSTLYKAALAEMRTAMKPAADAVKLRLPASPPLSGMGRGNVRTRWSKSTTRVGVKIGGRRRPGAEEWPLAKVVLLGAAASIFDMAGKGSPNQLAANLTAAGHGGPSRAAWPGVESKRAQVEGAVLKALQSASEKVSRHLAVTRRSA